MPYLEEKHLAIRDHSFLSEELMQPNSNKCDVGRTNMFTSHIMQSLVLNNPDPPLVFSGFENQVGKYTSAVKKFDSDIRVAAIIRKNAMNATYVLQNDATGVVDVVDRKPSVRITEGYGYQLNTENMDALVEGDVIPADTMLYRSSAYDEHGNLMYGKNLKTVYYSMDGMTYEDGKPNIAALRGNSHCKLL